MATVFTKLRPFSKCTPRIYFRNFSVCCCLKSTETIPLPKSDGSVEVSPKIENIVNEISRLTLIEVSELNIALKKKLNLPDAPAMTFGAVSVPKAVQEEETATQAIKTNFVLKLMKYDESKKVALIKEVKNFLTDMNLVQAKKFIESAPVIVKADISKDEAVKLRDLLAKHGAECSID